MTARARHIVATGLKVAVTALLLAWVLRQIELDDLRAALGRADWRYLWPIWALALLSYWLLSLKLSLILAKQGCRVSTITLFAVSAVTTLYGMVLPALVDLSAKWYLIRRQTGKGTNVLSSMVYNQFTAMLVVVLAGMAAILSITPPRRVAVWAGGIAAIVLVLATGILVLHRSYGPRVTRALGVILRPMPRAIRDPGQRIFEQLAQFQAGGWQFHANALALSLVANVGIGTVIYMLAAKAAGITAPAGLYFWQCTAIFVLGKLPISIAEFGVREATLVGSLALYGVEPSAALVMSMVILTNRLLLAAIGLPVQGWWTLTTTPRGSTQSSSNKDKVRTD